MAEPTQPGTATQYERDIGGLYALTRDLRERQDRFFEELGEFRAEQRRQAATLVDHGRQLTEIRGTLDEHGRALTEVQSMLSEVVSIVRRLEGR
jgi:hypothetical protein